MGLFGPSLPSFLDFQARRPDPTADRENARVATGGDPKRFKRNHVMVAMDSVREVDARLYDHGYGIEYAKMLSGVFDMRRGDVGAFVKTCRKRDVIPYVGGGATEDAIRSGTLHEHVKELHRLDIDTIEVSNSRGDVPAASCGTEIARLSRDFNRVLVEIGTKRRGMDSLDAWRRDLDAALDADADAVILEGAASGRTGIYDGRGWANGPLVMDLAERAGDRRDRFLIEAPRPEQRKFWVDEMFGWDVRLGNVHLQSDELKGIDRLRLDAMKPGAQAAVESNRELQRLFLRALFELSEEENADGDRVLFGGVTGVSASMLRSEPDWREKIRQFVRQNSGAYLPPQGVFIPVASEAQMIAILRMMGLL